MDLDDAYLIGEMRDKTYVTTASMLIFAATIAQMAADDAVIADREWRADAEAVLEKMAQDNWVDDVLRAEGVGGVGKVLIALKREARAVLKAGAQKP